ncbi:hypothetical protein STEG23_001915, partial [Scotinomys teguina]
AIYANNNQSLLMIDREMGDYMLEAKPKEISEIQRVNYEQNMSDAMAILHKLQTGLDVNVRFTGVRVFEYTPECIVFDLLDIPLYHGWLVDPQIDDIVKAVGNCSYNQLVEKIISCKQSDNSQLVSEGFVAEQFLNNTATQLTYHGLCELTSTVQEGELCVFFRNNHFSTMTKHKGQLYLLVTDQGFLTEEKVVWESLHNVDGDGNFCDSEFHLRPPSDPETVYKGQQDQIDQDYLMALSLQQEQQSQDINWEQIPEGISDLELAKKLQEEEDRRASQYYQEQEQAQAAVAATTSTQVQIYFMHMSVLLACISVHGLCARCLQKSEEGIRSSGTGVRDSEFVSVICKDYCWYRQLCDLPQTSVNVFTQDLHKLNVQLENISCDLETSYASMGTNQRACQGIKFVYKILGFEFVSSELKKTKLNKQGINLQLLPQIQCSFVLTKDEDCTDAVSGNLLRLVTGSPGLLCWR